MITTFSISQYLSAALSSLLQKHAFWLTSTISPFSFELHATAPESTVIAN